MKRTIKRILQFTHLWGLIAKLRVYKKEKIDEQISRKKIREVINKANELILEECKRDISKNIYIFQHSYYTRDGKQYISGGGERYATDLGEIIFNMGFFPILIQLGDEKAKKPWTLKHEKLTVIGLNISQNLYCSAIQFLVKPKLSIYSGMVNFGHNLFSPNIMISHGITWDNLLLDADTRRILEILKPIDELVSVDTNTINWLRSTYANYMSTHNKDMRYIPNYVDIEKYNKKTYISSDDIKIIFPRRLSPERGFWLIQKVLPEIMDKYTNVTFDFVGFIHTKDIESALNKLIERYKGRVKHYLVSAEKMNKVYEQADITLIPTLYSEGTSLSCIEAMASGNLVIATNVGGLPNLIINDFNGILIDPCEEELLSAIDKAVSDKEYAYRLRENAIKVSEQFSKTKWNNRWEKVLRKVLDEQSITE